MAYTKHDWSGILPASTKAGLEAMDTEIKASSDILDALTPAEAQTAAEATASADATAKANAAQAAAEATAAGALAGHVAALDPHTQYAKEADLGDSAEKNVGTTAETVAAGNAPAGAVTTHESTYAHANLPTANEKTRLSDIQAATGATTALKLANLASPASSAQQGVALLGASGGAAKLTKMPDGATAVYSIDSWGAGYDGWSGANNTFDRLTEPGWLRNTWTGTGTYFYTSSATPFAIGGKIALVRIKANRTMTTAVWALGAPGNPTIATLTLTTTPNVYALLLPVGTTSVRFVTATTTAGDWNAFDWLWIGDYSYLTGSLSEEAARIADQLGDTPGVGVAASGTITATDLATATKGDTIAGKKYTYVAALTASPGVEGEVLKGATKEDDLENLNLAISEAARTNNGTKYWAAAVHPLVSSARVNAVLTLTAKTAGLLGNQITVVCESGTNHTASGATLTGGKDAVGEKIKTQLNAAIGEGAAVGAIPTKTATSILGYFAVADCASGAKVTLPAGGTWAWEVITYGATYNSVKSGTAAGGAAITGTASANLCMRYERIA